MNAFQNITGRPASPALIPAPLEMNLSGALVELAPGLPVEVDPATPEMNALAQFLADRLNPATGLRLRPASSGVDKTGQGIFLSLDPADAGLGAEGYELAIAPGNISLRAAQPAGIFWGIQTLRQLFPAAVEQGTPQPGPWRLPAGKIRDLPRFAWRGMMLDVARHFFPVSAVKRLIDQVALYKINRLHLHLSDDQGWRLAIQSWPKLAEIGGSTAVNHDPAGFYTQAEYAEIVAYAQSRYITIVPEIDLPGHTNAALASYAELNCSGVAPELYTGTAVGFSSLCIDKEITYRFVEDVVREIAALTPGAYFHMGGDEAHSTPHDDYIRFVERVQAIVRAAGKRMVGWEEIANARLLPGAVVQAWRSDVAAAGARQGAAVIFSPGSKTYLDMQYDEHTPLGLHWAGYVEVRTSYEWDPATQIQGVTEADILGVEAPLWSETLRSSADIESMVFPRLPGIAEIGWSAAGRSWEEYRLRLAAHGPRLEAMGIHFYRSPQVPWK